MFVGRSGKNKAGNRRKNLKPESNVCHGSQHLTAGAGQNASAYLRVAQTYMLISMPTCTSTIFGAFQVMRLSQVFVQSVWRNPGAGIRVGATRRSRKRRRES